MKTRLAAVGILLGAGAFGFVANAYADTLDPLLGYCSGIGQCVDNGANSPTSNNPPKNFGFVVAPGPQTGDLWIDVLVPNNATSASSLSFALTGTLSGTLSLFSGTAWTTKDLESYLGISASPSNPIGGYLSGTQSLDAGATGFFVYTVDLGSITLNGSSNPNETPLENFSNSSSDLPLASYIVGFLNTGTAANPNWIPTANSGAIFETGFPPNHELITPLPGALLLMGSVLAGATGVGWRRKRKAAALAARGVAQQSG